MASVINAVSGSGITQTADGSGIIKVQSSGVTTNALAWVNFNGTGTVAIRSSYNVSSITDSGVGQYTVNFTNALTDVNYSVSGSAGTTDAAATAGWLSNGSGLSYVNSNLTTSCRVVTNYSTTQVADYTHVSVTIFGN